MIENQKDMARSIQEIKQEMKREFVANPVLREHYGLNASKSFDEQFSKVSLEGLWLYIIAFCVHTLECLFDLFRHDVSEELYHRMAHRVPWYRYMVLRYRHGVPLMTDSDKYDDTGLSPEDIAAAETVKFCAVEERGHRLYIKVAKGEEGNRTPIDAQELIGLQSYVQEIKDAGVVFELINEQADRFHCDARIYYNPMVLDPQTQPVENEIKRYVSRLEFNGEYTHVGLVDALQRIPGVVIPHLTEVRLQRGDNPPVVCEVRAVAWSGYWVVGHEEDVRVEYIPYNTQYNERQSNI